MTQTYRQLKAGFLSSGCVHNKLIKKKGYYHCLLCGKKVYLKPSKILRRL